MVLDSDYWATPDDVVRGIGKYCYEQGLIAKPFFDIDVCASEHNHKCSAWIGEEMDTFETDWTLGEMGAVAWCNPPYSRGNVQAFIKRADEMYKKWGTQTVMLLNTDNSTTWFTDIVNKATAIVYVTGGRIKFVNNKTGKQGGNPNKPNMFVVIGGKRPQQEQPMSFYLSLTVITNLYGADYGLS